MLRRFLFFVLVISATGHSALADDGVLSVELVGGSGVPLVVSLGSGDFNWDGKVDAGDLPNWRNFFGHDLLPGWPAIGGEGAFDGRFDGGDFLTWQRNLGRNLLPSLGSSLSSSQDTAIPEPASMIQLLLATALIGYARRRPACRKR